MGLFRRACWVALLPALVGCAAGEGDTASEDAARSTTTVTETVTAEPSSSPSPPTSSISVPPATTGPVVERAVVSSPTGNIWCALKYALECLVRSNTYAPLPGECGGVGDWADSFFTVSQTSGERGTCKSDTAFGEGRPPSLSYGDTALFDGHACHSTKEAMICWDIESQHGFWVSRTNYHLF